jgi:hypothetical protein
VLLSAGKKNKLQRTPLGIGFPDFWPTQLPELSDPPLPEGYEAPAPLQQHAAAAAGAAGNQAAAAYWPAAVDPLAAGYVQDAAAWQQPVAQPAARAPKALSKKQQQKIKEEQRRQAKAAASKKPKKRRRGDDDFCSEDESISVSVMCVVVPVAAGRDAAPGGRDCVRAAATGLQLGLKSRHRGARKCGWHNTKHDCI